MKTIVQISTPLGSGGISIVRMSGKNSLDIAFNFFVANNLSKDNILPRFLYYGCFNYNGFSEKCLMVYFKAPFSFTGEDVVEFQCHGGEFLTSQILNACLSVGAKLAENGEFSKLAFMNGKMSLDEAESTIDMINSTSLAELKVASTLVSGQLYKTIDYLQDLIKNLLANMEVTIDYPEYDNEEVTMTQIKDTMKVVKKEIINLLETSVNGKYIKSGINVAIIGKPNVGKSSLLNALIGKERAIVTNIQGTTRDVLTETITYNGVKINFIDTAGIRESDDIIEKIGINRAMDCIKTADIILCVFDSSEKADEKDNKIIENLKGKNVINIYNKCDIKNDSVDTSEGICVSALNKSNIENIKQEILKRVIKNKIDYNEVIITNERHIEVLNEALSSVMKILVECELQTIDILDLLIKDLWMLLGKITGKSVTENIIDTIFEKFCLGK